jgi:hypothetical protein
MSLKSELPYAKDAKESLGRAGQAREEKRREGSEADGFIENRGIPFASFA